MTEPYVRPSAVPADGRPRRLETGWFVAYRVEAPSRELASVQARIRIALAHLRWTDVTAVTEQQDGTWIVELAIAAPLSQELGI